MVLTTVPTLNLLGAPASRRRSQEFATPKRRTGWQMPQGFGKKDECGFLPKAAKSGWK